ncbi:hypothetical protein TWF694_009293 [Orbilia ellipsospora]|uniref:Rhodopsin domain-containing protein n=1 Tax=Orbilia ellipsospora TaxID=2528407 RepID=A0AAV9XEH1_9PEZI
MAEIWEPFGGADVKPGVYPKQIYMLAVVTGTPLISLAFTSLRLYAKRKMGWGLDDLTISMATALSILLIYPSWRNIKLLHLGIHIWDVNQRDVVPISQGYIETVWFNVVNALILPLVKASILLLLLKVGGMIDNVRKFLYGVFFFNAASGIFIAVYMLFQCPLRSGNNWLPRTFGNLHCAGRLIVGRLCIAQVCINMFTDLLIFPIPVYFTWRLQKTSLRNKVIVLLLFSLSLAVTGIGAAKIFYTYRDRLYIISTDDWTWDNAYIYSHWENFVAIVAACVPSLRVLILRWLGKEETAYENSGGSPIHITGGRRASSNENDPQTPGSENFFQRLRRPSQRMGLFDTTIGDHTIDLEAQAVKSRFDVGIAEEHDVASNNSETDMNYYPNSEGASTKTMNEMIEKPPPAALRN